MKNLEIKHNKVVSKIMLAGILALGPVSLVGCSSESKEKVEEPTRENNSDKAVIEDSNKFSIEKMSAEETKGLTAGMEIQKEPDRETLESMGLDFEVQIIVERVYEDNSKNESREAFWYDVPTSLEELSNENEDGKYTAIQKFKGIKIMPITEFIVGEGDIETVKVIELSDGSIVAEGLINPENAEKIQAILGQTSYTMKKSYNA